MSAISTDDNKVPQGGKVYYFTTCRFCIEARRIHNAPQFQCYYCLEKQTLNTTIKKQEEAKNVFITFWWIAATITISVILWRILS